MTHEPTDATSAQQTARGGPGSLVTWQPRQPRVRTAEANCCLIGLQASRERSRDQSRHSSLTFVPWLPTIFASHLLPAPGNSRSPFGLGIIAE